MIPGRDSDAVLVGYMLERIARIVEYTGGERQRFESSPMVQDAVVRNLQILTESSQRLSDVVKATEPGVPWRELAGFRNVVVHGYLGMDLGIVWAIIERDLPSLAAALERMAARLGPED